jgi:hypothetical protein
MPRRFEWPRSRGSATPRPVALTVELVLHCDRPDEVVDALRAFVDRVSTPRTTPSAQPNGRFLRVFLASHPRQVFSRNQLLRNVWGTVHSGERTVDVHVARLRQRLGLALIDTVRGVGYRLDAEVSVED